MTEKEEIEMCLNCPLPECRNCLGGAAVMRFDRSVRRIAEVRRMSSLGYTDREMGRILGVHHNTISLIRKELGIPNPRSRTAKEKGGVA